MMELAQPMIASGVLTGVREAQFHVADVASAREMMMLGTTMDVMPVVRFEDKPIGSGAPGSVFREFARLMREDIASNRPEMITPF
jgi:4-amino-4-deoxychorismate lyase